MLKLLIWFCEIKKKRKEDTKLKFRKTLTVPSALYYIEMWTLVINPWTLEMNFF